ncbi:MULTISPECIES: pentapeptide repeat-containing protein [unclassified Leptolyngbya]|uniref:pentapeptide repeat-containing protein n=1 Tax=unclassified Leptolyngbya TaxID=2650499 RepID=UPI0018EFD3DC|nr:MULTISPECIES: pentapeptide repeat-containing protein [unclassified Leptolyngbya]
MNQNEIQEQYQFGKRDFHGFDLADARLGRANLAEADLSGANLSRVNLHETILATQI